MRKIPILLAALLSISWIGCGAAPSASDADWNLKKVEGGLSGRFESSEMIQSFCMDGNEYDVPRMTVFFDPNGNPCIQAGCSDSIGCRVVETVQESLDAIGKGCALEDEGRKIVCDEGLTLVRQAD